MIVSHIFSSTKFFFFCQPGRLCVTSHQSSSTLARCGLGCPKRQSLTLSRLPKDNLQPRGALPWPDSTFCRCQPLSCITFILISVSHKVLYVCIATSPSKNFVVADRVNPDISFLNRFMKALPEEAANPPSLPSLRNQTPLFPPESPYFPSLTR